MATKYGSIKLRLPKGFSEMLQGFAREVLREQPSNIAEFGAEYFRGMLDIRNATGDDPIQNFVGQEIRMQKDRHFGIFHPIDGKAFWQTAGKTESEDILRPVDSKVRGAELEKQAAATKIQANYKGYSVRKRRHRENKAAAKIQAGYRGHATRKRLKDTTSVPPLTGRVTIETAETEDAEYDEEQQAAAVRIQANFRGHKARQELENKEKQRVESEKENAAAVRIQANYRGYKTRKDINKKNFQFGEDVGETPAEYETLLNTEEKTETDLEIKGDVEEKKVEEEKDDVDGKQEVEPEISQNELHGQEDSIHDREVDQAGPQSQEEVDLDDPDMEKAALRIQAQFRGYKTRKELKVGAQGEVAEGGEEREAKQEEEETHVETGQQEDDEQEVDGDNQKEEAAATRIQAQYRGYKTRKSLKEEKKQEDDVEVPIASENGDDATDKKDHSAD